MTTNVYITVDVESSMAGAWESDARFPLAASTHVFCENDSGKWGTPLIVEALARHGMKATFFCEMLASNVLGEKDTRSVTDYLLSHGQDVQLHLHPTFKHYSDYLRRGRRAEDKTAECKNDFLSTHDKEQQKELIEEACALFRKTTGHKPFAFRAGCFAADRTTLKILRGMGIKVDSSFDPCYRFLNSSFKENPPAVNEVRKIDGVWEFPITVARTLSWRGGAFKHFNISAISFAEMVKILSSALNRGMKHVVIIFHCFSTVKARNTAYTSFKPDRIVIKRLKKLLDYLAQQSSCYQVKTFGDFENRIDAIEEDTDPVVPELGIWQPAVRKAIQALNRFYWI